MRRRNMDEVLNVEHQKGMHLCAFVTEQENEGKARKVKHRELNAKNLSPDKRRELDNARSKEWNKLINSGAMIVHHGGEASKIVDEVGSDRVLQSRFVYTSDDGTNEGVLKARWCIKGYLDPDVLDVKTASPTLSNEGFAVTLQIVASHHWEMVIADIEGAFLRGDTIKREKGKILVSLPRDSSRFASDIHLRVDQTCVRVGGRSEVVVGFIDQDIEAARHDPIRLGQLHLLQQDAKWSIARHCSFSCGRPAHRWNRRVFQE